MEREKELPMASHVYWVRGAGRGYGGVAPVAVEEGGSEPGELRLVLQVPEHADVRGSVDLVPRTELDALLDQLTAPRVLEELPVDGAQVVEELGGAGDRLLALGLEEAVELEEGVAVVARHGGRGGGILLTEVVGLGEELEARGDYAVRRRGRRYGPWGERDWRGRPRDAWGECGIHHCSLLKR